MISTRCAISASSASRWLDTNTASAVVSQPAQETAHPDLPRGIEAVGWLVEDENLRIAQQGRGESEALAHPGREPAHPSARMLGQAYQFEHLGDPARRDPRRGGQDPQMGGGGVTGMGAGTVEHRPDHASRMLQVAVATAVHQCRPRRRRQQPEHHPHRRGLAGAVGADEAGDRPGRHLERHVIHDRRAVEPLGQRPADDRGAS